MVLDVANGQEQLDPITQSCGNPLEADIVVCLVQFINERAKVPFNRQSNLFNYNHILSFVCVFFFLRNWDYYTV